MPQSVAPIEIKAFDNPMCKVCGVMMRLYGIEPHPTLNRTDLRTYVCPQCERVQTAVVHLPNGHSTRQQPPSLAQRLTSPVKLGIDPGQIEKMHLAYEKACAALGLSVLPDKINEVLVTKIVELGGAENGSADLFV
jgi:hypothetical protein